MKNLDKLVLFSLFLLLGCNDSDKKEIFDNETPITSQEQVSEKKEQEEIRVKNVYDDVDVTVQNFEETEAGILKTYFKLRVSDNTPFDTVDIQGKRVSIIDAPKYVNDYHFSPRAVNETDRQQIGQILTLVLSEIKKNKWSFKNALKFTKDSERLKLTSSKSKEYFSNMMNAIEQNDQDAFIKNIVQLSKNFKDKEVKEKFYFLKAFSQLFVTKYFPSQGVRQLFLHSILRDATIPLYSE